MKALTLTQPWANLVAIGAKRIETRSWGTSFRGAIAIHAAKGFPKWARQFTVEHACYEAHSKLGYKTRSWFPAYPLGAVIATAQLVDCIPMREVAGKVEIGKYTHWLEDRPMECEFGDYAAGRYAWILGSVECFEHAIPAKGMLGLWEWEDTRGSR